MRMKFKIGNCYLVRFLDHTSGIKSIVDVEIVGWCLEEHDRHIVFSPWRIDDEDQDLIDNNHEPISIVKSCILKKKSLQLPKWIKE